MLEANSICYEKKRRINKDGIQSTGSDQRGACGGGWRGGIREQCDWRASTQAGYAARFPKAVCDEEIDKPVGFSVSRTDEPARVPATGQGRRL